MRTLLERAAAVAEAATGFAEFLGPVRAEDLVAAVAAELGHAGVLEGFAPYAGHRTRVVVPDSILHIVAGNTPHGALQSLIRGLLLGAQNWVKIPTAGLREVEQFVAALPEGLRAGVEISRELPETWLAQAEAVVVFGSDETIGKFRKRVRVGTPFQAHGHRVSFGVVFAGADGTAAARAARDVSLFDQSGCLSPHAIYVEEADGQTARGFAARLAEEMAAFNLHSPRRALGIGEAAAIMDLRAGYVFRSANDVRTQIWTSEGSTAWTVIFEEDAWWATSPLNRVVFVKPLPPDLTAALAPVQSWLGAIGIWPVTETLADRVAGLGASRICPLGRMQFPPVTWHAEGIGNFSSLIRWVDFEEENA